MIDYKNNEIDRSKSINSHVIARNVAGGTQKVSILKKMGTVIKFEDEATGEVYSLPNTIKLNVNIENYKGIPIPEEKTLQECYKEFGNDYFEIENYQGDGLLIRIIEEKVECYGWPVPDGFLWQERALIIQNF